MQSKKKRDIRIINPARGIGWTSPRNAQKYVDRGVARWVGNHSIRFIETDYRHEAVKASARPLEAWQMAKATKDDLKHTPVVMAHKLYRVGNDRMPVRSPRCKSEVLVAGGVITTTIERSSKVVL